MGICQSNNERRVIRLTKKTTYQLNENKSKKYNNTEALNNFKEFKIKEIKCGNFYNINNNYNYSISNIDNREQNEEPTNDLKLINQPLSNLYKEKEINEKIYKKLMSYFKSTISLYPYNNLSQNEILLHENEYTEDKIISPYKYIDSKKFGKLFTKIYELVFLKCEPLLNNLNYDNKKIVNLLFFRLVIVLIRENNLEKINEDIINSFIELCYDTNSNNFNKDKFLIKIQSFCEICYQILFYFVIACSQFTEEQYYEYLSDPNLLMKDRYSNIDIDIFCIDLIYENDKNNYKFEDIVKQWSNYILENINFAELDLDNSNKLNLSSIKKKIKDMINPYHLLEVLAGLKLET